MKLFIHEESGSAYRINEQDAVEFMPLTQDNVIDTDDFTEVEYDLVGDETITYNKIEVSIKDFEKVIRAKLQ